MEASVLAFGSDVGTNNESRYKKKSNLSLSIV